MMPSDFCSVCQRTTYHDDLGCHVCLLKRKTAKENKKREEQKKQDLIEAKDFFSKLPRAVLVGFIFANHPDTALEVYKIREKFIED